MVLMNVQADTGGQQVRASKLLAQLFNPKYHADNNPAATKKDRRHPCKICGWSKWMAIHDEANQGTIKDWAHPYSP